eukprot:748438-Hanusia_phi.AAC.5
MEVRGLGMCPPSPLPPPPAPPPPPPPPPLNILVSLPRPSCRFHSVHLLSASLPSHLLFLLLRSPCPPSLRSALTFFSPPPAGNRARDG